MLDQWSRNYYRSKFIVLATNKGIMGGTWVTIMFQEKPDKIFAAWVYTLKGAQKRLSLRAFDLAKFSEDDIQNVKIMYRVFLEDKTHAM